MLRIKDDKVVYAMSPNNEPALRVKSGERVIFETCDCFKNQIQDENQEFNGIDWNRTNPATGPLYIEEAKVGDILAVKINKINIADHGVIVSGPNLGVPGDLLKDYSIKIIKHDGKKAAFTDNLEIPLNPMIGVIGTAPKEEILCGTPDYHGGNMDCKEIKEGVTLYLPVNVEGGLLAIGDLHALMGDGEIGVSGMEIAGEVEVEVNVIKDRKMPTPLIENDEKIMILNSAITLDEAVVNATKESVKFISENTKMSLETTTQFLSATGDLRICQVVDPLKTVRMEIKKEYLEKLGYTF